jgi:hypothetical protein
MHDDPDAVPGDPSLQHLHHSPATARVPEAVGRGVFATGVIILNNPHELVIDFVQGISNPRRVAARVVLAHGVAVQFAAALEGNLARYVANFGPPRMPTAESPSPSPPAAEQAESGRSESGQAAESPSPAPAPAPAAQPIADIYDQIRLPDEMLGGAYANVVAITHTPAEFTFDFIASLYPRSVVTARVYMAAPRVAEALASLRRTIGPRQAPG